MVCEQSAIWVAPKIISWDWGYLSIPIFHSHPQSNLQSNSGNEQFELWGEQSGIWCVSSWPYSHPYPHPQSHLQSKSGNETGRYPVVSK